MIVANAPEQERSEFKKLLNELDENLNAQAKVKVNEFRSKAGKALEEEWAKLFKWHRDSLKVEQLFWLLSFGFIREIGLASFSLPRAKSDESVGRG